MEKIGRRAFLGVAGGIATAATVRSVASDEPAKQPVGIGVTIGLNKVDKNHYGSEMPLRGCINDAKDVRTIARLQGFSCAEALTDEKATRSAVIAAIRDAAGKLHSGDIFLLQYAGHGASVRDLNKDEGDGKDETWCLFDGMLLDDELARLFASFEEGVRVLVISDSCHSGSVTKGNAYGAVIERGDDQFRGVTDDSREVPIFRYVSDEVAGEIYRKNKDFYDSVGAEAGGDELESKASILLISGCQDNQLSGDLSKNGLFTTALKKVWDNGTFFGSYRSFHSEIVRRMPQTQSPNFYPTGVPDTKFWRQRPFSIQG